MIQYTLRQAACHARILAILLCIAVLTTNTHEIATAQDPTSTTAEQSQFFESKIRPILVEHCYECHATDSETVEAGLLLDSKWGWETGGDSGPAIIPHDPKQSLLMEAVRYEENVISGMPPRSKLSDEQIAALEQWITMGAPDPREKIENGSSSAQRETFNLEERFKSHWSWRPIRTPPLPDVKNEDWVRTALDRFVLNEQESRGLRPAEVSDKPVWLRRVYLDLIGIPPTAEQIAMFVEDDSDDAHEKVVDALLESPYFGEKWARHWLDLMRYAETYGHEFDYAIPHATEYRDYIIRALNADVPYNQFVHEHIAGDLLTNPRLHPQEHFNESVIGTGFWYLHEATHAPTDVLGNEAGIIDNQIDVFGKSFLGLTVACARCHDHKFDAISTKDYYSLSAYVQSSARQEYDLDVNQQRKNARDTIAKHLSVVEREISEASQQPQAIREAIQTNAATQEIPAQLTFTSEQAGNGNNDFIEFETFADGQVPAGWSTSNGAFTAIGDDLRIRSDGTLAMPGTIDSGLWGNKQVGVLRSPTFTIEQNNIHLLIKSTANIKIQVIIDNYQMASYSALLFNGTLLQGGATDTKGQWQWKSIGGNLNKYIGHRCYLEFIDNGDAEIAIDQIVFSNSGAPPNADGAALDETQMDQRIAQAITDLQNQRGNRWLAWQSQRSPELAAVVDENFADEFSEIKSINGNLSAPRFVLAMAQGTVEDASVYIRGSHTNLGSEVPPRNLTAFGGSIGSRLDLAQELTSPDNPLTARVIVNRIWHHLFGTGIVPTVDDFGPQGQPPSNPDLLDWLASEHMSSGWSIKQTIRSIVLSATYRQKSKPHPSLANELLAQADPTNQSLYFMPVRRLTGETIRDTMLAIVGSLDSTHFGGSVPTHRTEFMTGRGARGSGPLDGNGRRSIYLSIYRNFLNPFFATFDTPNPFGPQGRRSQSNVPAQALALMNDPLVIELSNRWGKQVASDDQSKTRDKITSMVIAAHGSEPTDNQLEAFEQFIKTQQEVHGKVDESAWSDLAHTLFNMKAFYFLR